MKIAIPYAGGAIFQHFGHTAQFKIYETQDDHIVSETIIDTLGTGHGALASFLAGLGVDVLICGGIGAGAQMALAQAGIRLYGGFAGEADAAVDALLAGALDENPNVCCTHHDEGHICSGHSCGSHSCGHH